jgi:zinc transport system ATP-binding protein
MTSLLVEMKNVSYYHPPSWAKESSYILQNIDLSLEQGTCTTIIGPNGCGKTTLLKILMGIIKPSQGILNKNPTVKFGYLPQHLFYNKFLNITVRQLLKILQASHFSEKEILHHLDVTGVSHLVNDLFHQLSGGQKQRVLLASLLTAGANVLVLDEPTQGIDIQGQRDFYEIINNGVAQKKWTVIMVSHDMHLVMRYTNQVICLNRHICCQGTPQQIYESKEYHKLFPNILGLAPYIHHHDHHHL